MKTRKGDRGLAERVCRQLTGYEIVSRYCKTWGLSIFDMAADCGVGVTAIQKMVEGMPPQPRVVSKIIARGRARAAERMRSSCDRPATRRP